MCAARAAGRAAPTCRPGSAAWPRPSSATAACGEGDEPVRRAAYADLGPAQAVHPAELTLFSDQQYEQRQLWNADPSNRLHVVPARLAADRPIDWTACWSMTRDQVR